MVSSQQSLSATTEMEHAHNDQIKEKTMEIQREHKEALIQSWCTESRKMKLSEHDVFQGFFKTTQNIDFILEKLGEYCIPLHIRVLREDISFYAGVVQRRTDFIGKRLKDILVVNDPDSSALALLKRYMIGIVIFLHGIVVGTYSPRVSLEGCLNYFSCWVANKDVILDEMDKVNTGIIKDILEFNCLANDEKIKVELQMTTLFNSFTSSEEQPLISAWTAGSEEKKEK